MACLGPKRATVTTPAPSPPGAVVQLPEAAPGFTLRLRDAAGAPAAQGPAVAPAQGEPLDAASLAAVLQRLPALPTDPQESKSFAVREGAPPPPRAGKTLPVAFAPQSSPGAAPRPVASALELLRKAPEGDVPLAPHVSLTFSQPMVALGGAAGSAARSVATLTPQPPGAWRWLGTQTVVFEPEAGRMPMATEFVVELAAGLKSHAGAALPAAQRFTFATPAPRVLRFEPQSGPVRRDALMFVAFDQRIEPAAVLPAITVRAAGSAHPVRLASAAEIAADASIAALVTESERAGERGRFVVVRPVQPLPAAAKIEVSVGPGTPSAEGPRKSAAAQRFALETYGPLRVVETRCGYEGRCPPGEAWQIRFSNPLDPAAFDASMVRVSPALPDLQVQGGGDTLLITGQGRAHAAYRVTLSAALPDAFGQTLGSESAATFKHGAAEPQLFSPGDMSTVLDPASSRFSVFSIGHPKLHVRVYPAAPEGWERFIRSFWDAGARGAALSDKPLMDRWVDVPGGPDALGETSIDLAPLLEHGRGQLIVRVDPPKVSPDAPRWQNEPVLRWVQATQIGLHAFLDADGLLGWATALGDGTPLRDVELSLWPKGTPARTGADGLARLPAGGGNVLIARRTAPDGGQDVAFIGNPQQDGFQRARASSSLLWYVADDRRVYRPGEVVHFKGWLRRRSQAKGSDLSALDPAQARGRVRWTARGANGEELAHGQTALSALGGFSDRVQLPKRMHLGQLELALSLDSAGKDETTSHYVQVEEFRRPQFEVGTQADAGPHYVGAQARVTAKANYYAGGALRDAEVQWRVHAQQASFAPPGRSDFSFGIVRPFWLPAYGGGFGLRAGGKFAPPGPGGGEITTDTFTARTDANGEHALSLEFVSANPPEPHVVVAEATVMDQDRQAWSSRSELLVHPAARYVGLRSEREFVQPGEALQFQAIVVDVDGKAVPGRNIAMRAARLQWVTERGEQTEREVDAQECAVASAQEPVRCSFTPKTGGQYRISAIVRDPQGRAQLTQLTRWVAGESQPPTRELQREALTLIPNVQSAHPGQTVELLVLSPFHPAQGVLTVRRGGVVSSQSFAMASPSTTLRLPIEEAHVPGVWLQVDLVGSAERSGQEGRPDPALTRRPAFARGELELKVPPDSRALALQVAPAKRELSPGDKSTIEVTVRDASGQPAAGAEVTLAVVDEAVLALSGYRWPDPLQTFYAGIEPGVEDFASRDQLRLASAMDLRRGSTAVVEQAQESSATGADRMQYDGRGGGARHSKRMLASAAAPAMVGNAAASERSPIALRTDFSPLALFAPVLIADAQGRVSTTLSLPDNVTRYRVMAIAAHGAQRFGAGEAVIDVRLPLMVRPSPPRFLNFGDRFELPVLVQNQTDQSLATDVVVRATNAQPSSPWGQRVRVPAHDRIELRVPAAAVQAGTARFQVVAVAGAARDAAEFSLPVWTPASSEAFATYGVIDDGSVAQPIATPRDAVPDFGGLELTTSSTALQALTDAVLYLVRYPFECSEQIASRVLAIASLRDVLGAFQAPGLPPAKELTASVAVDLERLAKLQNPDGGFAFFRRGDPSWPYLGIHVAHALARAQHKGFAVPDAMLSNSRSYLAQIERHIPREYPPAVREQLQAYALYVRKQLGDADVAAARALFARGNPKERDLETVGLLYGVLAGDSRAAAELAAIRTLLSTRVEETAAGAHFTSSFGDGKYLLLHSDRRVDAIVLETLIDDQPRSDLIPKLVQGLLAHRIAGRWQSTQENAFVLLALDRYFRQYEGVTPDFVARVWLGSAFAGEQRYHGRSLERKALPVPLSYLAAHPNPDLVLQKTGSGRLYYRLGLRYAPRELTLPPLDAGFALERSYEGADRPDDVRRTKDGRWHIRAGSRVRVKVRMHAPARRYHVALVDPLPAGLEPLNPALALTGALPDDGAEPMPIDIRPMRTTRLPGWWWPRPWYEHQNLRDERAEAFSALLSEGVHEYSYYARATTPGQFIAPAPRAEEMYTPETFGRASGDVVIVE